MLSVLIETRDSEKPLAHTLSALVPAVVDGLVRRVTVIDHGSRDDTALAAAGAGCAFFEAGRIGAALAEIVTDWVLLLQPGALPQPGWEAAARNHMETSGAPARFTAAGAWRPGCWRGWRRCGRRFSKVSPSPICRAASDLCG